MKVLLLVTLTAICGYSLAVNYKCCDILMTYEGLKHLTPPALDGIAFNLK